MSEWHPDKETKSRRGPAVVRWVLAIALLVTAIAVAGVLFFGS
jgi:hypothetical protein